MKNASCIVVPQAGNPHGYFLTSRTKNVKLYVKKVFEDNTQATFSYHFFYLDARSHAVRRADYKAFSYRKGIIQADLVRAATWFLTRYFSYRELHYSFPEYSGPATSGYYPTFGRHLAGNVFELQWD